MQIRPRRNRKSPAIRNMVAETKLSTDDLIYPLFLLPGENQKIEVNSMPGIFRMSLDIMLREIEECIRLGITSYVIFPAIPEDLKDKTATYSYDADNFYLKALAIIKNMFPVVCLMTDVALDPYSSDGHDGLVRDGEILNDETLPILAKMAVAQAESGADIIGPSDMMDGRVEYIRSSLDDAGYTQVSIMSYSVKYASHFYGPFRDALDSAPKAGDKKTYQMDFRNVEEAMMEADLDESEGADFLMVKPALSYLDVIHRIKENTVLPVAAYNVSGEYAMVKAAHLNGWVDGENLMIEILTSIKRAGADVILTYFAKEFAQLQQNKRDQWAI